MVTYPIKNEDPLAQPLDSTSSHSHSLVEDHLSLDLESIESCEFFLVFMTKCPCPIVLDFPCSFHKRITPFFLLLYYEKLCIELQQLVLYFESQRENLSFNTQLFRAITVSRWGFLSS